MYIFEHFGIHGPSLSFEVRDLSTDHAVARTSGGRNFADYRDSACDIYTCRIGKRLKRECEQRVTRKNCRRFVKLLVARRLATPEIVVIERRQIVMNQRIRMNEFQ